MVAFHRVFPIVAVLATMFVNLPSLALGFDIMSLIPTELLVLVPEVCRNDTSSEFQEAVGCAFDLFTSGCAGIIGVLGDFQNIPNATAIGSCEDILDPFCTIANTCTPCNTEFDFLIRCIVRNDPLANSTKVNVTLSDLYGSMVTSNSTNMTMTVADLLDTCALDCSTETAP